MAIPTTCASEIVFLDPDVPHCEDLVSGVAADRQVRLLDRVGDPLAQIAEVLDRCGSIDAVHIVTHGASGALHFAAGAVTQASLDTNREALARIGDTLAPGAEILLWACNTAQGVAGRRFLAQLAEATGAAVAAATRRVGSAERGGRWILDRATGVIAAGIPFTATTCAHYRGALPLPSGNVFDDTALTGEDAGPITILVLQNDNPESTEAIIAATDGGHGTVSIDYNGTGDPSDDFIVYTPNADFHGIDTFTYTATGYTLALELYTETATVTVTVNAVADIVPDNVTVGQDSGPNALDLLANDAFENPDRSIISTAGGSHGTVVINNNGTSLTTADDYVTYTPASGYVGLDTFTYTVFSGGVIETATVSVTVSTAVHLANDAATIGEDAGPTNIPVLANDAFGATPSIVATTDGAHGTVSISNNGTSGNTADDFVIYTPDADFNGADSFTYTVTSGGVTVTGTVNVTVNAAADIVDDNVTVNHDSGANNLNLLANDTFENSSRSIAVAGAATHGTTAINNNGTPGTTLDDFVVYTPTPGYSGLDAFTYTVTSGGVTETATVNITVSGSSAVTPTASNDILSGSDSSDTIAAESGDDLVNALGGSNLLYGNQGNDSLLGGDGNDTAYGGLDNDRLSGGGGKDLLFGNEGADTVDGGEGNNTIVGGQDSSDAADSITAGSGADLIWGNGGADTIVADGGNNTLVGGFGTDTLVSGAGDDILFGNEGNDTIGAGDGANTVFGGLGDDSILAGAGNDSIFGNEGNDTLAGGNGADRYVFAAGSGNDQINGFVFADGDRLDLQSQTFTQGTSGDGDVLLMLSGGGTIELNGIAPASFSSGFVV